VRPGNSTVGFLTVDCGTSTCRAALISRDGKLVCQSRHPMRVDQPAAGFAEVNTDYLWGLVQQVIIETIERSPAVQIEAMGVSAMLGWVFLDSGGLPVAPAIIYMDNRAVGETAEILQRVPEELLFAKTGRRPSPLALAPKLKWLERNRPAVFARLAHVIGLKDDIVRRLTGVVQTDYAHLDYSLLFNVFEGRLDADILEALEIEKRFFPQPSLPTRMAGKLRPDAARRLKLPSGLPVVAGSSDGTSAMYGGGILEDETAVLVSGSTDVFMMAAPRAVADPTRSLSINTAAVAETFLIGGPLGFSGASLDFFQDLLQISAESLQEAIAFLPPGAEALLLLPGLTGERAPYWMEHVTGALAGLTPAHRREHILRAAMEATAFRILKLLNTFHGNGLNPRIINLAGGGSQLEIWNQIRADVTGKQIRKLAVSEATCLGTAFFCRAALEPDQDPKDLGRDWIKTRRRFFPDSNRHESYRQVFELFEDYLHICEPVFRRLAALRIQREPRPIEIASNSKHQRDDRL